VRRDAFGGFLGVGAEIHTIPWQRLRYDTVVSGYRTNITESQLQNAPEFSREDRLLLSHQQRKEQNTMIHQVHGQWHQTVVHSNTLSYAQRLFPKDVKLSRHGGPVTDLLGGLGVSTMLRLDVVRDAQLVLNMPTPLKGFGIGQE
jgi:hypothetical protein